MNHEKQRKFSFSQAGCFTKFKDPRLSDYLPIVGVKKWLHASIFRTYISDFV